MKRILVLSALALSLCGCLGGGGTGGNVGSSSETVDGVATPSSVSVVTATQ